MLGTQVAYLEAMKRGRTLDDKDRAREIDQATHAKLNKLRSRPENAVCFDCDAIKPGWAVMPHGIFVCMDCAQLHRSLGRHISQTKAVNTGTYLWMPDEVAVMVSVGNGKAETAFAECPGLPKKPTRSASVATKEAYVRAKYAAGFQPRYRLEDAPPLVMASEKTPTATAIKTTVQHQPRPTSPPDLISFAEVRPPKPSAAMNDFFAEFGI